MIKNRRFHYSPLYTQHRYGKLKNQMYCIKFLFSSIVDPEIISNRVILEWGSISFNIRFYQYSFKVLVTISTVLSSPRIATTVFEPGAICVLPASCITEHTKFSDLPLLKICN